MTRFVIKYDIRNSYFVRIYITVDIYEDGNSIPDLRICYFYKVYLRRH